MAQTAEQREEWRAGQRQKRADRRQRDKDRRDMDREKAAIGHDRRHRQPRIARADEERQEAGIPEKAASDIEMIEDENRVGGERDDADRQRDGCYYGPADRPAC